MSVKNFKISTGLDLEGLILTAGQAELLVDGSPIATQQYVTDSLVGIDFDLSDNAGSYLDWNSGSSEFDVDIEGIATDLVANAGFATTTDISTALTGYATELYVGMQGYATESYVTGQGYITSADLSGYATESFVTTQGYLVSSDLTGYVTETGIQDLSNKTIIDTLYFSDSVTIAQEGEIAVKATTHEFEIKANYGDLTLKTVAAPEGVGSNVNISSLYGDVILTAAETKGVYIGSSSAGNRVATRSYVDSLAQGLDVKQSVKKATVGNITLSGEGLNDDGTEYWSTERVLVKEQTTNTENGIYVVNKNGAWERAADATGQDENGNQKLSPGAFVFVETTGKGYVLSENLLSWSQFSEAGSVTAGNGINLLGQEISVDLYDLVGQTNDANYIDLGIKNDYLGIDKGFLTAYTDTLYQSTLTAGTGIDITDGTISSTVVGLVESVDDSFVVTDGELSLSDTITIASVELTDSVAGVTAASDVFGNADSTTYAAGSAVTIGTLPAGAIVADVFVTFRKGTGPTTAARTSKLTFVNIGADAPTWTEYGIINSGQFPATTISFDSSGNIIANVNDSGSYAAMGVVTVLKYS
jgi:hypothetical protein